MRKRVVYAFMAILLTASLFLPHGFSQRAQASETNLAQGKTVTASSFNDVYDALNVNDGNQETYWESENHAFPQWIQVDLGAVASVNQVVLKLPTSGWSARTQTLAVQGSSDGKNFMDIVESADYTFDPDDANTVTISFGSTDTRYVRLHITDNTGWPAAQISEFEVYGTDSGDPGGPDLNPPATPQNLSVTEVTESSVSLAWDEVDGADGYKVLRDGNVIDTTTSASYQDTGLDENTSYTYTVRAFNDDGDSDESNSVNVTTDSLGDSGASLPYSRYDTRDASYGGGATLESVTNFDQKLTASEASHQSYVALPANGSYLEWTVREGEGGAGVTMRFTMPDSADGMGLDGSLDIYVNGVKAKTVSLTSYYSWQYFSSDQPVDDPSGGRPLFRFDEVHFKLDQALQGGDTIRIEKTNGDNLEYGVDFIEIEPVPDPITRPVNSVSVTDYGAVPNDGEDDLAAFEAAVNAAVTSGKTLYIPEGTFHLDDMWEIGSVGDMIDDITITGAGMWYTNLQFTNPNKASGGISLRISGKLDFGHVYMNSMLRSRYNENAIYKALMDNFGTNSRIHHVWEEHFEAGIWVGDYAHTPAIIAEELVIENSRMRNNLADGVNFAQGTSHSTVRNSSLRNNGDDALAVWTSNTNGAPAGVNNTFSHNTIENNWRAAGIAFFGGSGHKADHNLIKDCVGGSAIRMNTVFPGYHFENNTGITFSDTTIVRCGTSQDLYNGERGAIDLEASNDAIRNVTFTNIDILNTQRDGVQFGYGGGFENIVFNNTTIDGTGLDGVTKSRFSTPHKGAAIYTYTSNGSAMFNNLTTRNIAHPDTYFIQPGFDLTIQ